MIQNAKEGMLIERESKVGRWLNGGETYRIGMIVRGKFANEPLYIFMYRKGSNFPYKAHFDADGNLPGWREVEA